MSSQSEEDLEPEEEVGEDDVIYWDEEIEDHTLAVLEGDLEDDPDADVGFEDLDGREGVAKVNTEKYITDFEKSFEFRGAKIDLSVERDGGLNKLEYWSDDPDVLEEFDEFLQERVRTVEHQPYLEDYKIGDVRSDEVAELVSVYEKEFEMDGPLPRKSNGQPRVNFQRLSDLSESSNEYRVDTGDDDVSLSAEDKIPVDAKYVIEGLENSGEEIEGVLKIKPEKHETGRYVVRFDGEDAGSQAYMVNTGLEAIDPEKDDERPF